MTKTLRKAIMDRSKLKAKLLKNGTIEHISNKNKKNSVGNYIKKEKVLMHENWWIFFTNHENEHG